MIKPAGTLRTFIRFAAAAAASYCVYCIILLGVQRMMIYPGTTLSLGETVPPPGTEVLWFGDGENRVEAWFIPAKDPRGAVIYAHGNYELIQSNGGGLLPYRDMGLSILMMEYPGYGRSAGSPTQNGIVSLFVKGYDWVVTKKGIPPGAMIFHGRSLGGGIVCALSMKRRAAGLVLESTFTSMARMARSYLAPPFIILDRFDNLSAVRSFRGPILVIHGTRDRVIPFHHGRELYESAHKARFMKAPFGHNDFPHDANFWKTMRSFTDEVLPSNLQK